MEWMKKVGLLCAPLSVSKRDTLTPGWGWLGRAFGLARGVQHITGRFRLNPSGLVNTAPPTDATTDRGNAQNVGHYDVSSAVVFVFDPFPPIKQSPPRFSLLRPCLTLIVPLTPLPWNLQPTQKKNGAGAGKTHTMMGSERVVGTRDEDDAAEVSGIVPQSLVELFRLLDERVEAWSGIDDETETWNVRVGYLQVGHCWFTVTSMWPVVTRTHRRTCWCSLKRRMRLC